MKRDQNCSSHAYEMRKYMYMKKKIVEVGWFSNFAFSTAQKCWLNNNKKKKKKKRW